MKRKIFSAIKYQCPHGTVQISWITPHGDTPLYKTMNSKSHHQKFLETRQVWIH